MKQILVTNDDGIHAPGLKCLEESLAAVGEVTVVAPDKEMSASSQAISPRIGRGRRCFDRRAAGCRNAAPSWLRRVTHAHWRRDPPSLRPPPPLEGVPRRRLGRRQDHPRHARALGGNRYRDDARWSGAVHLDLSARSVELASGREIGFDGLVVATGAWPAPLAFARGNGRRRNDPQRRARDRPSPSPGRDRGAPRRRRRRVLGDGGSRRRHVDSAPGSP